MGCVLKFQPLLMVLKITSCFCASFSCANARIFGSSWHEVRHNTQKSKVEKVNFITMNLRDKGTKEKGNFGMK
jgi:hypothetical protein